MHFKNYSKQQDEKSDKLELANSDAHSRLIKVFFHSPVVFTAWISVEFMFHQTHLQVCVLHSTKWP